MRAHCFECGDVEVWKSDDYYGDRVDLDGVRVERTRCPECGGPCYIGFHKLPSWLQLAMRLGHAKGMLGRLRTGHEKG